MLLTKNFLGVIVAMTALTLSLLPVPAMGQDSLGFGDEISVQVQRANQTTTETNGEQDTDATPSGCLIATAAFGSELSPQVQFLRDFRDHRILPTTTGSSFMNVFNSWYYSFSPQVADYEREQTWFQQIVKTSIYPLLGILHVAEKSYGIAGGEGGSVLAGFVASSLIGMAYLAPAAIATRRKLHVKRLVVPLAIILANSLGMIALGVIAESDTILMIATPLFVLSSMGMGIIAVIFSVRIIGARLKKSTL